MKNKAKTFVLCATFLSSAANTIDLSGTVFDKAAKAHNLDPLLVYSVALAESASGRGDGSISPWPWTLRVPGLPFYAKSEDQAKAKLAEFQKQYGRAIDVGFMQVNIRWNGHRVSSPVDLLNPETNVMIGAEVLSEAIKSSPNDLELGIGRYHAWEDEIRARNYGSRILSIYRNLHDL
ncbi:transglycosylase (plasmid) [Candidatus Williamhamiltonella defendens]|uniref:Transglycosylase n=1 Tax=Candidatus Williamhamiltonella defendens TaxID=138072 RepID=A0A2D3TAR6_9ENTR|nr:transglycosylase SLT domain-containing protein [Candidatus Hamiltonella defensa]ATW30876.1 transglycosylase [Candidatus Hamiltonella defensa]ATW30891.1 transglycosylase [Candidatus Hamiltonella defensa]ATW32886.1 transglycosylase [Candidatus Hamiltonella defensa]ATW34799.1 transglycosylase [Candidatus Hamiltonella defensa]ATW34821.1 transglycosylase [Candidatus Hamiltonella defensa]